MWINIIVFSKCIDLFEGKKSIVALKKKQLSSRYEKIWSELEMISYSKKSQNTWKKNNVKSQDYITKTKRCLELLTTWKLLELHRN